MPPATGDELRPVTALFADIVGSTYIGERLGVWTQRCRSVLI
jgi:class 3 adenylate cyclase